MKKCQFSIPLWLFNVGCATTPAYYDKPEAGSIPATQSGGQVSFIVICVAILIIAGLIKYALRNKKKK